MIWPSSHSQDGVKCKKFFRGRGILFYKFVVGKEVIRMIQKNAVLTFGIIAVLVGCVENFSNSNAADQSIICNEDPGITYICGLTNAEDLLALGDSGMILTSGMSSEGGNGHLYLVNTRDNSWEDLVGGTNFLQDFDNSLYPACSELFNVNNFSAHGLALKEIEQNFFDLYMTSHGAREAIEIFKLDLRSGSAILTWRGCVPLDESIMHNSVAILSDGGFVTTQFMVWEEGLAPAVSGETRGSVVEWHPGGAPEIVLGTELSAPNGIVVSNDERYMFVAALGAREIVRFDLAQEPITKAAVSIESIPDNIRWGEPGKLLTAGGNIDFGGWSVVEIDASELTAVKVGGMDGEAAMQGISSALQIGEKIWVGTYSGDRIGYFEKQ